MKSLMFSFCVLTWLLTNTILSQINIDGNITDADFNPIENALVEIFDLEDTSTVFSGITNTQGYFSISILTGLNSEVNSVPSEYIFLRNYPNPFNPSTIINYEIPKTEKVEIKIYDILGREVCTLLDKVQMAGSFSIVWNGRNDWNQPVSAGIYFCRLKTKNSFKVHKMILLDGGSASSFTTILESKKAENSINIEKLSSSNFIVKVSGENILTKEYRDYFFNRDTTLALIVPKIIGNKIIGTEGGEIQNEIISLTVPQNSFSDNHELSLVLREENSEIYVQKITQTYEIYGLPEDFNNRLIIQFKNDFGLSDSIYGIIGRTGIDPITKQTESIYNFVPIKDSNDYFYFNMYSYANESNSNIKKGLDIDPSLGVILMLGKPNYYLTSEKFEMMNIPFGFDFYADYLFNNFEDIFEWFADTLKYGYNIFDIHSGISINFTSKYPISSARPDRYMYNLIKGGSYYINICKDRIVDTDISLIKQDQAHYIYQLFPFIALRDSYNKFDQYWLHHAISSWSEGQISNNQSLVPLNFHKHLSEPFKGIQPQQTTDNLSAEAHGIGLSSLIQYLTNQYGNDLVRKLFHGLSDNHNALGVILDTLSNNFGISENNWWPNFFKEYLQGNIYNISGEDFVKNINNAIYFNDGDTIKYITETYNDLSAKLFRININSEEVKSKTLNFKIDEQKINIDYVKTMVFGYSNNNLTFLTEGTDFNVSNFQSFDALIACVVNSGNETPYTGTSDIDLDIKVTNDLVFRHCDIKIAVQSIVDTFINVWSPAWYTDGVFKDNVYTGEINPERQGGDSRGSVRIVLDDDLVVLSLDVMAYGTSGEFSSQWGITAANVPVFEHYPDLLQYRNYGNSVCTYVTSIYAKYTNPDESYTEVKNFKCDEESLLQIKFHNYD